MAVFLKSMICIYMEALNEKKYNIKIYVEDNLDNESKYQYIIEPDGRIIKTTYNYVVFLFTLILF